MNIPEIETECKCKVKLISYEIYDNPLQYPEEWDWNKISVRKPTKKKELKK